MDRSKLIHRLTLQAQGTKGVTVEVVVRLTQIAETPWSVPESMTQEEKDALTYASQRVSLELAANGEVVADVDLPQSSFEPMVRLYENTYNTTLPRLDLPSYESVKDAREAASKLYTEEQTRKRIAREKEESEKKENEARAALGIAAKKN